VKVGTTIVRCPGCGMPFSGSAVTTVFPGDTLSVDCGGCGKTEYRMTETGLRKVGGPEDERRGRAIDLLKTLVESGELHVTPQAPAMVQVFGDPYTVRIEHPRTIKVLEGHQLPAPVIARLEAGVCRWCAGDGLEPHLSDRIRQQLAIPFEAGTYPVGHGWPAQNVRVVPGVSQDHPLAMFLEKISDASIERHYGLTLLEIRCPRCLGTGNKQGEKVMPYAD
jgi:hypothetical protein